MIFRKICCLQAWDCAGFSCLQSWFTSGVTLRGFSNFGSCHFSFGQGSVAAEVNHIISHVSGHWFRTALNHTLTNWVICFLLGRETCKDKSVWQSICQGHTVLCAGHMTITLVCYMQQKGKVASATASACQSHMFPSKNSKLLKPVTPCGSRQAKLYQF